MIIVLIITVLIKNDMIKHLLNVCENNFNVDYSNHLEFLESHLITYEKKN